jgi:hypothetical protein
MRGVMAVLDFVYSERMDWYMGDFTIARLPGC